MYYDPSGHMDIAIPKGLSLKDLLSLGKAFSKATVIGTIGSMSYNYREKLDRVISEKMAERDAILKQEAAQKALEQMQTKSTVVATGSATIGVTGGVGVGLGETSTYVQTLPKTSVTVGVTDGVGVGLGESSTYVPTKEKVITKPTVTTATNPNNNLPTPPDPRKFITNILISQILYSINDAVTDPRDWQKRLMFDILMMMPMKSTPMNPSYAYSGGYPGSRQPYKVYNSPWDDVGNIKFTNPNGSRVYKPSPKHDPKSGWGSPDPIPDVKTGQEVLDTAYSSSKTKQLYNYYDGKLVKFQPDTAEGWHSYEVLNPAKEVPVDVLRQMLNDGKITKSQYKDFIKNK